MPRPRASWIAVSLVICTFPPIAFAANDVWDNNPGGNWANGANWVDGSSPGNGDTATFNLAQTYSVTFSAAPPAIQNLTVSAGTVTFESSGGPQTLSVNATTGALGNDLNLSGATTTLNLGTSGNPLNLTMGDDLSVQGGATLEARFGSDIAAGDLSASGLNGTLRIDGIGSTLTLSALASHLVANTAAGSLLFQNGSVGNSVSGALRVADGASGVTGSVSITAGSSLTFGGVLALATQNVVNQNAILTINGASSILTQSASSPITVGSAANGSAAINIGVAATGGTFTTGTGLFTINDTGTVAIGSGANTGTLNANGDVAINGGALTRGSGSTFALAAGKTMTIQNGGSASFTGDYFTDSNAIYDVTGASSTLQVASGSLVVDVGAQVNVAAGGSVSAANALNIGAQMGSGTLTVDGSGSSVVASSGDSTASAWGFDGAATVTLSNNAMGTFNGGIVLGGGGSMADVDILSGADLGVGNLLMATNGAATTSTLDVQGSGSTVTQIAASSLIVGHATTGTAAINIGTTASGAVLTTGTSGQLLINATGTVTIGSSPNTGTLNANNQVTIDGGELIRNSGSNFTLASGRTMTIENGGAARFTGNYVTAASAIYNISGAGSILETTSVGNTLTISGGTTVTASAQGAVSAGGSFTISNGTLVVNGAGSSADASSSSQWATGGSTADVTFSNGAAGSFPNGIQVATSATANTTADISVLSGADLDIGSLNLATSGGATTSATLTVDGAGSTLTTSTFSLGHASTGTAVVNVLNDGALIVDAGTSTTLNATGTLNINGGTVDLKTLNYNGGTINFTSGSLSYLGNLTVGTGGLLGFNLILNADRQLTLSGATTIDAAHFLAINGGTLNTGTLVVNGTFLFNSGTLGITQNGATINTPFVTGNPTTVNINANNVSLGSAASFNGFNHQGTLNVGANTVTLNSAGYARLGTLTSLVGGTINAANGVALGTGSNLVGHGTVMARVAADLGSVIEADGALAMGEAASPIGFVSNGELRTKQFAVTLNASSQATLGSLTSLGSGASPGTLNVANGAIVDFGHAITGFGTINSTNTLAKRTIVNGLAQGNSIAEPITFSGYVKGVGTFDNVTFTGTFDPGLSPTLLIAGNLAFSSTSLLNMELGGLARGSAYDAIDSSGQLAFDGTLQISLINGFNPAAGNSFDLFDGTMVGMFDTIGLPSLGANLMWNASQLYTAGVLSVAVAGDYNLNGTVDAADYVVWRNTLNQIGPGLPADGNNNGQIDNDDYNVWRAHFGQSAGSSSGSGATGSASASAAVPEPTTLILLLCGATRIMSLGVRRRSLLMSAVQA